MRECSQQRLLWAFTCPVCCPTLNTSFHARNYGLPKSMAVTHVIRALSVSKLASIVHTSLEIVMLHVLRTQYVLV